MNRLPFFSQDFYDMINDRFDEVFDPLYEQFITLPLVSIPRNQEIERALVVNQRISTNIHAIRRQLEIQRVSQAPQAPLTPPPTRIPSIRRHDYQQLQQNINQQLFNVLQLMADADQLLGLNQPFEEPLEDVKVTLEDADFEKLETYQFGDPQHQDGNANDHDNCNICLEQYGADTTVTKLPCRHVFHTECIKAWLCGEKINCPVCRHDVRNTH
jgi:hypothetical protein